MSLASRLFRPGPLPPRARTRRRDTWLTLAAVAGGKASVGKAGAGKD